jgi:hypothetical protein
MSGYKYQTVKYMSYCDDYVFSCADQLEKKNLGAMKDQA